jgi:hypothetical protein
MIGPTGILPRARLAALFLVLGLVGAARADEVEVVQLSYRTAEQLIPTLRPLVEPGGALTGQRNMLVIRASRANIAQIKQVVATLDTQPRRLLISVRHDAAGAFAERGAGVSGTIGSGNARIGINEPPRAQSGVSAGVYESRGTASDRMTSQVQALEGSPAYISTGQSMPIRSTVVTPAPGGGSVVQSTTTFQNVASGFYVTPRLSGDRVVLEIAPQRATPGPQGTVNVQQITTTASGRLGEWIELGGVAQSAAGSQSGVLQGASGVRSATTSVWVRVDEIR